MPSNNFTIVRLILATLVIFGHFKTLSGFAPASGVHSYADFAVDAFFIVSGYLVYGSFDNSPKLKGFYIKRFFRIYPLYSLMIFLQMFLMLFLLGGNVALGDVLQYLGSNLVFLNFISPDMGGLLAGQHNPAINPSLWTLKIEAAFYLIVPLLWWLVGRAGIKTLLLIYIASTIFALVALYHGSDTWAKQLPGQMRFFVVGIALYHFRDKYKNISLTVAALAALALFIICSYRHYIPFFAPIYPLLLGALVFICVLRLPPLNLKYDISYGVYLIHAPLIQTALVLGIFADSYGFLFLLWAVVYILAFAAEKFIELPMIALGKKYAK